MTRTHAETIRAANRALLGEADLAAIGDFFAPNYVAHGTHRRVLRGHNGIRRWIGALRRAFRDVRVKVEILAEGKDRVAWLRTVQGTHTGAFQGFPPTGRRLRWRDMVASRFRGGRIAEDWVITDLAEQMLRARRR
jgi:predicted ester cyclase